MPGRALMRAVSLVAFLMLLATSCAAPTVPSTPGGVQSAPTQEATLPSTPIPGASPIATAPASTPAPTDTPAPAIEAIYASVKLLNKVMQAERAAVRVEKTKAA